MCSQSVLNTITSEVVKAAKEHLGDKIDKVILYGSYARGDHDSESDIDIMVLANIDNDEELRETEKALWDIGWDIGYEYDVLVAVYFKDCETFYKYVDDLPFYMSVQKDGVELYAN